MDVLLTSENDGSDIGIFSFENLPRKGEDITIPWDDDDYGVRCFVVQEVLHVAAGAVSQNSGTNAGTILRVTEIT